MSIFEKASREKLRFSTSKGQLSVEDLWELSLKDLDTLAKGVNAKLKESQEESFIATRNTKDSELELKLDILKSVIKTRLEEKETAKVKAENRAKREFFETLLEKKKTQSMETMSIEEIEAQLQTLGE